MASTTTTEVLDHGRSCLLITGAPGAGKSTVSRLVAQALTRSALLNGDFVNELIVSGRVWALGEPAEEAGRQVRLCNDNLCALAENFAAAGFTPVLDWIIPDNINSTSTATCWVTAAYCSSCSTQEAMSASAAT